MSKSAYIKLVKGSKQSEITLEETKNLMLYYQEMTSYTGQQLDWDYQEAAFPYEMEEREQEGIHYLLLTGKNRQHYNYLMIGTGQEKETGPHYIQIVLPDRATHGDKAKANEYAKFLAKQLQAELHLFNDRIMYFNERKG
ncbi:DUF1885 family protein [Paenactinomyces guangxiensis]|uniref:DUF1885 family protein n=1 Tax=Paenactinomyces guangxiensis TaxID=1490290 RepID=A0A7W1WQP5_9BACL|nr:DUF1885 family protein [Paenactinomyces guangxiensis]MBA4494301.1 DUF1885 family protein [Paenactinomyces guangxiensis]MBH8590795.1 DUF1885 family protein [Paenactinomyces guangxiensis]